MSFLPSKKKYLLILELNGLLGLVQKPPSNPSKSLSPPSSPTISTQEYEAYHRPHLSELITSLLTKHSKLLDVGIWTCQNKSNTESQLSFFFGRYFKHLLFVSYTPTPTHSFSQTPHTSLSPFKIEKSLDKIYSRFKDYGYSNENTIVCSNYENEDEKFKQNDVILPVYDREAVSRNDDMHLMFFNKYLLALFAMEAYAGMDVRNRIAALHYEKFVRKIGKNVKAEKNKSLKDKDLFF